jgi:MFS family permease
MTDETRSRAGRGPRSKSKTQATATAAAATEASNDARPVEGGAPVNVLANRPFLLLWLAQLSTQVGGNMVIYGLTIIISSTYHSSSAVSVLLLSFLLPAIIFSAIAGVFVDQVDKRHMLIVTNVLRGFAFVAVFLVGDNLLALYALMVLVSTITTFFGPAEASMIPFLVPREQLLSANGLFTLTMNVAFALGFALLGPFVVALANAEILILIVAALYFVASVFCWTLPTSPGSDEARAGKTVSDAEKAVESMVGQFVEGVTYIRDHKNVGWSLSYLFVTGALVGILGVLGPGFATSTLALGEKDFGLVVLPLGIGIAIGILFLNSYGRFLPRRRTIETGIVGMGVLLILLSVSGPISHFLQRSAADTALAEASRVVSLMALVMSIAMAMGAAYAVVAIAAQTQLQEELPEDVRGRVFGVLNMLVSIASLAPIVVVGPIADAFGLQATIFATGLLVSLFGASSVVSKRSALNLQSDDRVPQTPSGAPVDPMSIAMAPSDPITLRNTTGSFAGESERSVGSASSKRPRRKESSSEDGRSR